MKIILAVVLNAALLAALLPWLRREWRTLPNPWRVVFGTGLALRLGTGLARDWHPKDDAAFMSLFGHMVTAKLRAHPAEAWAILTQAVTVFPSNGGKGYPFVFQNTSNTWILIKLLAVLNLASLDRDRLNALYLSLFAFAGCWLLVRKLAETFPATPAAAGAAAFLLWPSVCFWATGLSKEAVLLSSGAWLTARVVSFCYRPAAGFFASGWGAARWWLGTAALAGLHFGLRYFFAVPLLGALAGVVVIEEFRRSGLLRSRWAQALALALLLGAGAWLVPQLSKAFSANKFTSQVMRVYDSDVAHSAHRPHFEYPDLRPTFGSIAAHAPLAVTNALTRPWLGESWQPLYVAAALENAALLVLLAVAAWAVARRRAGRLPFGLTLGLLVFCVILAFLIGLTTPNLGSLNRYRCALLPYLLLLLLQNDYAAAALRRLGLGPLRPAAEVEKGTEPARPPA